MNTFLRTQGFLLATTNLKEACCHLDLLALKHQCQRSHPPAEKEFVGAEPFATIV